MGNIPFSIGSTTFTDALMQAKRASQLRGIPFSTRDVMNLQSGYMASAFERTAGERSAALAEKAQTAQKKNWTDTLAQEKELATRAREQNVFLTREQIDAQKSAANKALTGNIAATGLGLGAAAYLMAPKAAAGAAGLTTTVGGPGLYGFAPPAGMGAKATAALTSPAAIATAAYLASMELGRKGVEEEWKGQDVWEALETPATGIGSTALEYAGNITGINELEKIGKEAQRIEKQLTSWIPSCIIITACTDPKSYEVNVARKYRDTHMDKMELRGYYQIAEKVVPLMKRFDTFKRFVKKFLVDGIIDYCEYATGIKTTLPRRWSAFIMKAFLGLCGYVGSRRTQFVRSNGEVF